MKIVEKLKKTGRRAWLARLVILFAIIFLLMAAIKGLFYWTYQSSFEPFWHLNNGIGWLIEKTSFFPTNLLWDSIPALPFLSVDIVEFYKILIPPLVIFVIGALFIADHQALKAKYRTLKSEIQDEIDKRDMRKDAGLETVSDTATVDVVISNATNNDPTWLNTWWGKIIMAVAIALVLTAIGLK